MSNINEDTDNIEKELFPLIEYAKWELYNFNLLKKTSKPIQKELIIIDKETLKQWKEKSGYNIFKKQIFNYLSNMNKLKNQKEKINEENNKLNMLWKKSISDKKIYPMNIKSLPKKDISSLFLNIKEKMINGYKQYEIISGKLYDVFKNFINHKIIVNGFYNKGKLVIPLNYKNINNEIKAEYFLDIIYINKKNELEKILYVLPNDINICNQIEKDVINDNIENLTKNIFSQITEPENMKEFFYCGDDGTQINYKVLNKRAFLNQKNKTIYSNQENKQIKINTNNNKINNNYINKENNADKLRLVLLEKIKNYENLCLKVKEKNANLIKIKSNLENEKNKFIEEKNIYYNKLKNEQEAEKNEDEEEEEKEKEDDSNHIKQQDIDNLKNKFLLNQKEYEKKKEEMEKIQKIISDKERFLQKFINKNNNLIKLKEKEYKDKFRLFNNDEEKYEKNRITIGNSKSNYLVKEDDLKMKEDFLIQREKELIIREKNLIEKEKKIKDEKIKNEKEEKELDRKLEETEEKLIYMKNQDYLMNIKNEKDQEDEEIDDKELKAIQDELEKEMNFEMDNNLKNSKVDTNIKKIDLPKKNSLTNSFDRINSLSNRSFSPKDDNKITNINFTERKNKVKRYTINPNSNNNRILNNNIENTTKSVNNKFQRSKTITGNVPNNFINKSLNNNLSGRLTLNPNVVQTQTKINKLLPSLGLEYVGGPINLNSILQCLAHLPEISEGLLELGYKKFFKERKDIKLSRNFATTVNNIFFPSKFNNNTRRYSPKLFVETFLNMYPLEKPNTYSSTLKIFKFIIDTFHEELNNKKNDDDMDEEIEEENNENDATNEKEVLVKFLTKLTENNNSLISKLFFGLIKLKCECDNCGNSIYAFDYYSYLYFDLLKIKNYMLNNKFKNNNSIFLSLNDCFDFYRLPQSLKTINNSLLKKFNINKLNGTFFCSKCNAQKIGTLYKSIFSAHTILPIILERGNDNDYFVEDLKFPDELNLENYVEFNKSIKKYFLCGVVSNLGINNSHGKFCAYCRMTPNSKWFSYNNQYVSSCTTYEVHQKGVPHMLFYHKI